MHSECAAVAGRGGLGDQGGDDDHGPDPLGRRVRLRGPVQQRGGGRAADGPRSEQVSDCKDGVGEERKE